MTMRGTRLHQDRKEFRAVWTPRMERHTVGLGFGLGEGLELPSVPETPQARCSHCDGKGRLRRFLRRCKYTRWPCRPRQ